MIKLHHILFIVFGCFSLLFGLSAESPTILIKIVKKSNSVQFLQNLDEYYKKLSGEFNYHFHIVCDLNDPMHHLVLEDWLAYYPNLSLSFVPIHSQVEAYNYGIQDLIDQFDILLIANDEQTPLIQNYDKIIVEEMLKQFPNYDGVLNFYDGDPLNQEFKFNKLVIMGKRFYELFGYVYYPAYTTTAWSNFELTMTSRMLAKEAIINQAIVQSIYFSPLTEADLKGAAVNTNDQQTYFNRFYTDFDLDEAMYRKFFPKDWSILICTLPERKKTFNHLYNKLKHQILVNRLQDKVEILYFLDNREHPVGFKRNVLMQKSKGLYVNFIDDDDDIDENYVKMIYEKLSNRPDCVALKGFIDINRLYSKIFIHSIAYNTYFELDGVYYRPPNHLNTMKRSVASRFLFPLISYGEDGNWAMQIARSGLLKTEAMITKPYYYYFYRDK